MAVAAKKVTPIHRLVVDAVDSKPGYAIEKVIRKKVSHRVNLSLNGAIHGSNRIHLMVWDVVVDAVKS